MGLKAVFRYKIVGDVMCIGREFLDVNVKLLIENVNECSSYVPWKYGGKYHL